MSYSVILLAGGQGSRMHETVPKQYLLLAGKPMIMHSIERIDKLSAVDELIIVCDSSYRNHIEKMNQEYNIKTKVRFAEAGKNRQDSVYSGLQLVKNDSVIIHEAARPFVKEEAFQALIDDSGDNVIYGYNIPFTVVKGVSSVNGILDRSELTNVQLPQKFKTSQLKEAYSKAIDRNEVYTEDASLMYANGYGSIKILKGTSYNIKITEPLDLLLGEMIYKNYITNRK